MGLKRSEAEEEKGGRGGGREHAPKKRKRKGEEGVGSSLSSRAISS